MTVELPSYGVLSAQSRTCQADRDELAALFMSGLAWEQPGAPENSCWFPPLIVASVEKPPPTCARKPQACSEQMKTCSFQEASVGPELAQGVALTL